MIEKETDANKLSPAAIISENDERRILILAPTGIDAHLTAEFLAKTNLSTRICHNVLELCHEIGRGCGAVIVAEEALSDSSIGDLLRCLDKQPSWSDIPIVVATREGEASKMELQRLGVFGPGGNVSLLERPFRPGTLRSTVEVALRARERQYEARQFVQTLQRARDEAEMANRAKDTFLAALSHELRTPLSPVLLIASERARDNQLPEEVQQDFETIQKNVELEARLIDDLLDMTRVGAGKLVLKRQDVNLHSVLLEALNTVRPEIQKKEIQLIVNLATEHCVIYGDAVRLQQVFWNILSNAVKFTPKRGTLKIESYNTHEQPGNLVIRVTDSGIGMTAEESARIFQPFVQGDHADGNGAHRFGGLGLGLTISKNLIQLHSGTVTAESPGRNQGSTFTVTLPLSGETAP